MPFRYHFKLEHNKLELFVKFVILVFLSISIFMGNQTAEFNMLGLRGSQWMIVILLPITLYLLIEKKLHKDIVVQVLLVFIAVGFFAAYRTFQDPFIPLKFLLASSGLYLYPLFFLMSLVAFEKKDMALIFNVILISNITGLIFFVGNYLLENGQLPFFVRTSSDILPILSAGLVASIVYSFRFNWLNYSLILLPLIFFSYLMFVKGAILAILATLVFITFRRYLIIALFASLFFTGFFLWFFYLQIEVLISYANQGDIFWYNIVTRLLVWKDYFLHLFSSPTYFIFGSGIEPFFSEIMHKNIVLSLFSDCNGVIHHNPHNSYLLIAHYSGVLSLVLFFFIIFKALSLSTLKIDKQLALILPLTVFFLMLAMTTPVFELHYIAPIFWLLLGLLYRYKQLNWF